MIDKHTVVINKDTGKFHENMDGVQYYCPYLSLADKKYRGDSGEPLLSSKDEWIKMAPVLSCCDAIMPDTIESWVKSLIIWRYMSYKSNDLDNFIAFAKKRIHKLVEAL